MHELINCNRCGESFECKPGNITQCQCYAIRLTEAERTYINGLYDGCLCASCLRQLQQQFREAKTG